MHTKIDTKTRWNPTAHTPTHTSDNSRKTSEHTHGRMKSCCEQRSLLWSNLWIWAKPFLICMPANILPSLYFRALSLCVCVRGQGVKCVVVMETPLRLPSQLYLSVQHSSLSVCLSVFLSVCLSVQLPFTQQSPDSSSAPVCMCVRVKYRYVTSGCIVAKQ